ncbi:MAG: sulfatase-like hydrolase/transferase [Candidatus Latescibacteria bacterium]|nr:sulfatase-like hydrolase/transferase [Candidatus Latescibacterota bacterium]
MSDRPNILVIMSDEHDPAVMGCYGDSIVQTPHMDRLAEEGIVFDAAYTTSPLCAPARASFTAVQYVSRCGVWTNDCQLPSDDYPSLPHALNAVGYECWLGGKMHFAGTHRYGFRDVYPGANQGDRSGKGGRRAFDDLSESSFGWEGRVAAFKTSDTSPILEKDRKVTAECSAFLQNRSADDKPFFLLAGYLAPHFPLTIPEAYYVPYKDKVSMPEIPEGFLETLPTNYKHLRAGFGVTNATPEQTKLGRELYWGFVNWLDDEIGKLLSALNDSEVADNTIVIYCTDHGENKGDHGLWWKNNMYEHASRTPLIVSFPKRWAGGQRRTGVCSLVDLAQTIAEISGAERSDDWDGESLLNYLDDGNSDWRDIAVSEYYAHNIASGIAMIRQGPWKYVYHTRFDEVHGPERELYNLEEDAGEFNNLADDPAQADRIAQLHDLLTRELRRDPEEAEAQSRADLAKGY